MSTQAIGYPAPAPAWSVSVGGDPTGAVDIPRGDLSSVDWFSPSSSERSPKKPSQSGLFNLLGQKAIALYQWVTRETPVKHLWKNIHCLHREKDGELSCSTFGMEAFKRLPWYKAAFVTTMRVGTCAPFLHDSRLAQRFGDHVLGETPTP